MPHCGSLYSSLKEGKVKTRQALVKFIKIFLKRFIPEIKYFFHPFMNKQASQHPSNE